LVRITAFFSTENRAILARSAPWLRGWTTNRIARQVTQRVNSGQFWKEHQSQSESVNASQIKLLARADGGKNKPTVRSSCLRLLARLDRCLAGQGCR
jgi:hypothetical protein